MDELTPIESWHLNPDYLSDDVAAAQRDHRLLLAAIPASLLLHAVVLALMLTVSIPQTPPPIAGAVQIRLVPANPQAAIIADSTQSIQAIDEPEFEPMDQEPKAQLEVVENLEVPNESLPAIAQPNAPTLLLDSAAAIEVPVMAETPVSTEQSEQPASSNTLPSLLAVQQTVKATTDARDAQSWLYHCNSLQKDSGLHSCDESRSPDYAAADLNASYRALNPIRQVSATQRSLSTVYQQVPLLAARLAGGIEAVAGSDYLLEQLEANVSLYSDTGTGAVQHLQRMSDKSAAAQQAQRVLGDPWVRARAAELQQRKVHAE